MGQWSLPCVEFTIDQSNSGWILGVHIDRSIDVSLRPSIRVGSWLLSRFNWLVLIKFSIIMPLALVEVLICPHKGL